MTQKDHSSTFGVSGDLPDPEPTVPSHQSIEMLRVEAIAPRDIIMCLPDAILDWLHSALDRSSRWSLPDRFRERFEVFDRTVAQRVLPHETHWPELEQVWTHSRATAVASRVVAAVAGLPKDTLYVCGLLHDIGLISALRHVDEVADFGEWRQFARQLPAALRATTQHAVYMAMHWRLPSRIRFAIRDHAMYDTLSTPCFEASATIVAEHLAKWVGFGTDFEHRLGLDPRCLGEAMSRLKLPYDALSALASQVSSLLDAERPSFQTRPALQVG
jgi:hypothetical protein